MIAFKKVAFYTLGCKLNFSETSTIGRLFENAGYAKVDFEDMPDIYIINTCSVTENADKKCKQLVKRAKKINPDSFVAIIGCYAQLKPEEIANIEGESGEIEVWGDGLQTRSFLYIDECIEATRRLMSSNFIGPINIGSEEMVTINELVDIVSKISNKSISKRHKLDAPLGVRGRNSDNTLIRENLNWDYKMSLSEGIKLTYGWIEGELRKIKNQDATLLNL